MFIRNLLRCLPALVAGVILLASAGLAQEQQSKGKAYTLRGKVTDVGTDRLTVNHERVEGYMAAMTMPYKVDKPDVLARVKTGDQIEATVYQDDYTLYDVKVVPPPPAPKK